MKKLIKIICLVMSLVLIFAFVGCGPDETPKGDLDFKAVYERAQELGFEGTLEELIEMFKGDKGLPGADGATWHTGEGGPSNSLGKNGDFYLDTSTFDVYLKGNGGWYLIKNIIGPKGDKGTPGKDGATWTMGTTAPNNADGKDGDLYMNVLTGDIYVKAEGAWQKVGNLRGSQGDPGKSAYEVWLDNGHEGTEADFLAWLKGNSGGPGKSAYEVWLDNGHEGTEEDFLAWLKGDPGKDGATWATGTTAPDNAEGKDGDLYMNTLTWDIYVKAEGTWEKVGNLKGTQGDSAYQIYLKYHPEYEGDEEQWMDDLVNGRLADKEEEELPTEGLKYTPNSGGQSYSVSKGTAGNEERIVIASVYEGKPVTIIGNQAFMDCLLKSIKIPDSVEIIDYRAFRNCINLKSIKIPDGVTSIGGNSITGGAAFSGCTSLESIKIPDGVTSIQQRTFFGCRVLETVTFGQDSSLKAIGDYAFYGCTGLDSITIPDSVTSIGDSAFVSTGILDNAPDGVLYVDKWAVSRRGTLSADLTLRLGTVGIAGNAFSFGSVLTHFTITEGIRFIGDKAFYHCENLTSIVIPASMTSIGDNAFSGGYDAGIGGVIPPPFVSKLTKVFYGGADSAEWDSVAIGINNRPLTGLPFAFPMPNMQPTPPATRYYYSETQTAGCWRWIDGIPTVW